jgi:hypothetical protein
MDMSKLLKMILAVNLFAITVLVFAYPNLMVGPGKLIPGHKQLETDCFACHSTFTGATSERCLICHKPAEIGRLTSVGKPISKPLTSAPFHQQLLSQQCISCHSDHSGVKRFRHQGHFNHALLKAETLKDCQGCHKSPKDALHEQIMGNCGQCHNQEKWVPATFDHRQYFVLDGDHNTRCVTCHLSNDYKRYTCYGCHEHTPLNIRREHIEEGISNFDDCVRCHRSADEEDIRNVEGKGGSEGRRKRENNDD